MCYMLIATCRCTIIYDMDIHKLYFIAIVCPHCHTRLVSAPCVYQYDVNIHGWSQCRAYINITSIYTSDIGVVCISIWYTLVLVSCVLSISIWVDYNTANISFMCIFHNTHHTKVYHKVINYFRNHFTSRSICFPCLDLIVTSDDMNCSYLSANTRLKSSSRSEHRHSISSLCNPSSPTIADTAQHTPLW